MVNEALHEYAAALPAAGLKPEPSPDQMCERILDTTSNWRGSDRARVREDDPALAGPA